MYKFSEETSFLSNHYECPVKIGDITYLNSESAFQAQKTPDEKIRREFAYLNPDEAKAKGRKITLRDDWENIKLEVMYEVCKAKFEQNEDIKKELLATGNEELVEISDNDDFWGLVNGEGENNLGRILMRVRNNLKGFDVAKTVDNIIKWIRDYFNENAKPETKVVIGISGGKDSSVASALCVRALGINKVFGVLMPQGKQSDIEYSRKLVDFLKIDSVELNIKDAYSGIMNELETKLKVTEQARVNTPARIRMTMLYAVASCIGGRVANTCNLSEDWVGYATKFGDGAGDFSILSELTVTEVIGIGDFLGLPYELVHKIPIDGLCGKTDEENLGFTYAELDEYIRGFTDLKNKQELKSKIDRMNKANRHKLEPMPKFMI